MFFWLIAIPFFVIIAMFTLFRLPSSDLNQPEEIQDAAMAFRMALQHDAAAKLMEDYKADSESTFFDLGSYNIEGDDWKTTLLASGYLPASFVSDTDNIVTYVRCLNSLREITSCRTATGVYIVTAAAAPSSSAITSRWFETAGAERLAEQLEKYSGSFPVKQDGLAIPVRPVKEEDESDEDFAVRLNAYKTAKSEYMRLKRRYYNFGEGMPRPDTTVGQVRAYPFDGGEEADERVIVRRIRSVEGGTVNYDLTQVPVDIPDTEGQVFDFNGEAVILTASFKQPDPCVTDEDCFSGAPYCNAGICGTTKPCSSDSDCSVASIPYCVTDMCAPFNAGTMVYEVNNITTASLPTPVAQVGTYTISTAGKYQVRLMGEAGYRHNSHVGWENGAGGVLIANKNLSANTVLTFKGIQGIYGDTSVWSGAGVAMWDSTWANLDPVLAAGGGDPTGRSGGGYYGGYSSYWYNIDNQLWAYGWDGTKNYSNTICCTTTNCEAVASGGAYTMCWSGNGCKFLSGSGICQHDYSCTNVNGGTGWANNTSGCSYPYSNTYGNQSPGYAAVVYCGPSADSPCPEGCGNGVGCTTGNCNYKTGLCE